MLLLSVLLKILIFVTSTTSSACGEKICHVEKFFHMTDCHVEKFLHMRNVKKIYHIEKVLHMTNVEQNVVCGEMWRNHISLSQVTFFCCICCTYLRCFVAKSVLSQNLFCRDLRAFVWRKIEPKIVLVEKKRQISGMLST